MLLLLLIHIHLIELRPVLIDVIFILLLALRFWLLNLLRGLVGEQVDDVELILLLSLHLLVVCCKEGYISVLWSFSIGGLVVEILLLNLGILLMRRALVDHYKIVLVDIIIHVVFVVLRCQHLQEFHKIWIVVIGWLMLFLMRRLRRWLLWLFSWGLLFGVLGRFVFFWRHVVVLMRNIIVSLGIDIIIVYGRVLIVMVFYLYL